MANDPDFPFQEARHPERPDEEIRLRDYVEVFRRRRAIFLAGFLGIFSSVALVTFLAKPVYEAEATLHVRNAKESHSPLGDLLLPGYENVVDAEIEILKSRTSAEEVARRLHLDRQVSDRTEGLGFQILEFASDARDPDYRIDLTGPDAFVVTDGQGRRIGAGRSGVPVREGGLSLLVSDLKGKAGDGFRLRLVPFPSAAAGVQGGIRAAEIKKYSNVIRVSYLHTDPERARDVVNTLVQVYLDRSVAVKSQEAGKSLAFLEEQLRTVRRDLDAAEENLESYKSRTGVVQLDREAVDLIGRLSEAETARADVVLKKKQVELALASLKEASAGGRTYAPSVLKDDPLVSGMAAKLAELSIQKKALRADYTEAHPAVKAVQGQIEELHRKLAATYETTLKGLEKQETSLGQYVAGFERDLKKLPEAEVSLARLTRHTRVNADIYTFLLQKHEEARIARAATISNIDVIDTAVAPESPIKPNKVKNLTLGLLVGLMLGAGLAFFQEHLDDTVKSPDEAKRELGMPLLSVIPFIPQKGGGGRTGAGELPVLVAEPQSPSAEAFRGLRTSIRFSAVSRKRQVILATSTSPKEGKTTVAVNLAGTLAQTGASVLLLDCDLRRPMLHEVFGRTRLPGLTELLAGDAEIDAAVRSTDVPGLGIVTAGTAPPNPSELLGSDAMRRLLAALRERYEHIFIDAPPVLPVTDAPLLSVMSDMVLVVLEAGRVPVRAARQMREVLDTVRAPVIGVVVNDKSAKNTRLYGHYGYGYYHYGLGEEDGRRKKTVKS